MAEPKRLLFIEDDAPVADMYSHELKRHGYQVEVACDGAKGLDRARSGHYDVILVDLMIPKPDGIEVIKQMRGKDGTSLGDTKVVILTNLVLDDKQLAEMNRLADKYLIKANTVPSQLIEALEELS
jgi:CheY-like chemotaxis protein